MIAVGLAAAFVLLVPHKYTATTQILIDPMDLRGAAQSDISTTIPQSDAAVLQVESQARVIASDNVLAASSLRKASTTTRNSRTAPWRRNTDRSPR